MRIIMSLAAQYVEKGQSAFGSIPSLVGGASAPPPASKYLAREGVDALSQAFDGKIAVHPGLSGGAVEREYIPALLEHLLDQPRTGRSVAYIHVPFCQTHCLFCGFYNKPYRQDESRIYADALTAELELWRERAAVNGVESDPVHALYLGGGTPTALEADDLLRVLTAARENLPLANDCEITVEGRLHNFDTARMEACLEGGANRFSLGVQSFHTDIRRSMGRLASREEMAQRLEQLLGYNEAAVIVDLIYGFPGQSMEHWKEDLAVARSLQLDGADCYQLNVYRQTPLGKAVESGKIAAPADVALRSAMYAAAVEDLDRAFYRRLSLSHWGRTPRERNLYNLYVKGDAHCLAFGPGAGGSLGGHFYMVTSQWEQWLEGVRAGRKPVAMLQKPQPHHALFKAVSEQMEQGRLELPLLERRFGLPLADMCRPVLEQWGRAGLLEMHHGSVVLTLAGQFWQVNVAQLLLDYIKKTLENTHVA